MGSLVSTAAPRDGALVRRGRARARAPRSTLGGEPGEHGAFYPPTVVAGVESSMTVAQEEVFGPVVTIIPFEDEQDAIRIANDVKYGLMASVWTGDPARGPPRSRAGSSPAPSGINMPYTAFPGLPFGGYKQSGFGRELGDRVARPLPRDEERARQHGLARRSTRSGSRSRAVALPLGGPRRRHARAGGLLRDRVRARRRRAGAPRRVRPQPRRRSASCSRRTGSG